MADSKGSLKSFFRKILRLRPRDQIEKAWTEDDPTFGYRPSRLLPSELVIDELPLFTLRTARMMLSDPVVRIGLTCRNAALAPAQIEVACKDARVREWIGNQWQYLWNKHRTSLLRAKIFGHVGLQLELEKNKKTGTIDIAGVKEFAPEDIRPLSHGGKVAALRVKSRLSVPVLLPPRGVYLSFDDDAGNPGGASILKRAYSPWWEKHMPTGALATRRLRLIKDAYIGDVFQFPFAETVQDELGNPIPWRDIIRSVSEARLAGATIVIPRKMDAEGNEQITYTPPQDTGSPTGIYEWVDKLDRDIWRGLDVFEEVIQAAETGSGFSGRSIPLVMFLEGCEEELVQIIKGLDQFVFGPLTYWNFGPDVEYDIKVVPLVKTFATEMGGSPMGGESMGGQAGTGSPPPGGQPPQPPQQGQPAKPKPGPPGGAPQRKPTQFREPAETGGIPTIDYAQSDAIASRTVSALRDVMRLRPSEIQREVGKQRRGQQRLRRGDNTLSAMLSVIPILITRKQQRSQEIAEDGLFASAVVGAAAAQATLEREAEAVQAAIVASPTAPTEPVAPAVVPVDEIPMPEFRTVPTSLEDLERVSIAPTPETETEIPKPPRGRVPSTEATFGRRKRVRFPNEIRARKKLRDSIALAGQDYRETARMVREDAFAITTKMGDDIVAHIRDALKKNMREGMDLKSFIAEVEKIQRGQEYPLSRARIELVFRANTARYLSDAADAALNHPLAIDQFPYRAYSATHDDRVRDTHLRLEQTGLNGTNVYRADDPAWKAFRPPWAYSCRCAWRPVGVRQAARIGVVEANNWLARATARANADGGIADQYLVRVKPASGEHVAWPSIDGETFYPSPEWTRNGVQFGEPWGRITVDKPTEAQKEAGNYRKGHVTWNGLRIAIENPRGSVRSGDGWRVVMKSHYGYIKSTEGRDGDHVDVFLGPNPDSEIVFVVNQVDRNGKFDEHKCLIGWDNEDDAKAGYLANYSKGWKCGPIVSMTLPQFKQWLENGNTRKPCCEQFAEVQRGLFGDDFDVESKPTKPQKKSKPESTERQGMLWTGLDLLPGQRDFLDEGGDEVTKSTKGKKPSKSDDDLVEIRKGNPPKGETIPSKDDFESKHPRKPAGNEHGGEFAKKEDSRNVYTAPGISLGMIPRDVAYNAHRNSSFVPETRASQRQEEFAGTMQTAYDELLLLADTDEKKAALAREWPEFVAKSKRAYIVSLQSQGRVASSMITGPARFPVERNRKRNETAHKKSVAYLDQVRKGKDAIAKVLRPESATVKIGDQGTGSVLTKKLADREKLQETMKQANAIIRKHVDAKQTNRNGVVYKLGKSFESVSKDLEAVGVHLSHHEELLKPDYMGRVGFPDFKIKNNGAEIRRLKGQLDSQANFEAESESVGGSKEVKFSSGVVHLDYDDNRIRIIHDSKPSPEVISKLKQAGFRWSPTNKAWQRQLTNAAKHAAHAITGADIAQFREAAQSGWITLGGGASVFVDNGHIELGCPGLKGEDISDLIDESDESRAKRRKRQETAEQLGLEGEDVDVEDLDELEAGEAPDDANADFDFGANAGTDGGDSETDPVEDFERQATEFALGLGFGPEVLGIDRASINVAIADGTPPEVYAQSRIDDWMAQFQPGAKIDLKNRQFRRGTKLYKQIAESVQDEHGNVNDDDVQYFGSVLLDVLDMRQREAIDWNQTRRDMLWEMGLSDGMAAARIAKEINAGKDATQIKRFDEVLKVLRGERGDRYRALLRVTQSESEGKDDDESALKDLLATRQRKVPSLEDNEVWQEAWSAAQYGMQRAKTFDPDEEYWKSVEFSEPKHWALNYWDWKDEYFQERK